MTRRLASLLSGALEVVNAIAFRLEDVIGEWVDNWGPRPATREREALALLARWNDDALIDWNGEGGFEAIRSPGHGGWAFGVSNVTVAELIDDTAEFCRGSRR